MKCKTLRRVLNKVLPAFSKRGRFVSLFIAALLFCSITSKAQTAQDGATIFKTHCMSCHSIGKGRIVGPDLKGVTDKLPAKWLTKWIKGSQKLVKGKDKEAVRIFKKFNNIPMPNQALTDVQIKSLLDYIKSQSPSVAAGQSGGAATGGNAAEGEKIFKQHCAACHFPTNAKLVGPGLKGITSKRPEAWLLKWIKNSQALVKAGDPDAKAIFKEFNNIPMPPQTLTDDQIKSVLAYLSNPAGATAKAKTAAKDTTKTATTTAKVSKKAPPSGMTHNWAIFLTTTIIICIIMTIITIGGYIHNKNSIKEGEEEGKADKKSIWLTCYGWMYGHKKLIAGAFVVLFLIGFKGCWDGLAAIGVAQNYQPTQPINFSHKIHAGINKINCIYCHSAAIQGKTSGIPSANVCMNCHKYIQTGKTPQQTADIHKIYKELDYNPATQTYGPNKHPIAWVRIHNLPDFAYFNHAQHVVVGKVKCQTCHGPVQTMDVVKQYSPLTMQWCINCHRTRAVHMQGNGYYTALHKKLEKLYKGQKITVEKIGGLDCIRCHY